MCKQVIIIGSGLGGLSTGVILGKNGYRVTVLEQGAQVGGCLQCFERHGVRFETGMHFIGAARPDETLGQLFRYLEITDKVKLSPLDRSHYNVIGLNGKRYPYANGREAFIDSLAQYFPQERKALESYCDLISRISHASSLHSLRYADHNDAVSEEYMLQSIDEVIDGISTNETLHKVLVGDLPLYAAERGKTPFATHAFIRDFYLDSAFRIVGGSDHIALALVDTLKKYGGEVLTRAKVTRILCDDKQATGVEVNGKEVLAADIIISDAHPIRTLELVDSHLIRPAFRHRVSVMPQTMGGFSVYLQFKPNRVPYMNYNYFGYNTPTPWDCEYYDEQTWPKGFLYMHLCSSPRQQYAESGILLSYMDIHEVEQWKGTRVGHRGDDYEAFKQRKAERLIASLTDHFPELRGTIARYYTSTPLTYLDYTGTADGSMYGIAKDVSLGPACRVPHKTKIPNLLMTGQNINSHGMLGVLVGTIVTCSELLSAKKIYEEIKNCQP
ncbi:MAG: NAD(P)/FAD-dependent oxidoreductase [Prevotella sp.]|nr:NAD(P)/FAD-dependent oxidoreductase [Prevotella sp.]